MRRRRAHAGWLAVVDSVQAAPAPTAPQPGHGAVLRAIEKNTTAVTVPLLGELSLPSADSLAWYAGLTAITVLGVMDWPVAVAIGVGHLLAHNHHVRLLKDFGEALEEA